MQEVYETVHWDDPKKVQEKMAALTGEQRAELFDAEEYMKRVKAEANRDAFDRHLSRDARREEVRQAVIRAQKFIAEHMVVEGAS